MDVRFLRSNGVIDDHVTLFKGDARGDARALTATFADGTLGGLVPVSGSAVIAGEALEVASFARLATPAHNYMGASMQVEVAAGMPAGASVGLRLEANRGASAMGSAAIDLSGGVSAPGRAISGARSGCATTGKPDSCIKFTSARFR